jgi:type IV pilus assembly protein PilA
MRRSALTSRGYTLIELLLALAVTGVLGAVIASSYRTYAVRGEVLSGIELANDWRKVVEKTFEHSGQIPGDWRALGVEPQLASARYVEALTVVDGRLDVTFGREANAAISGRSVSLTPYETASLEIIWVCGNAVAGRGLKPLGFAAGGTQSVQRSATVESRYLPAGCR